jgi:hypothetical protein
MAQPRTQLENVKRRLPHYLDHNVAQAAGLRLEDLQRVISGVQIPTAKQLDALARRMYLPTYPETV